MNTLQSSRRRPTAALLVTAALAAALAACGGDAGETLSLEGYPAPFEQATDATNFTGNPVVVLATASAVGEPRWNGPGGNRPEPNRQAPEYIWTPVTMTVDQVLRGGELVSSSELTVRFLGGSRDGVTVEVSDLDPPAVPAAGTQLLLFLNPPVDAGDGLVAATPNHAYTVQDGVATASNASHALGLAELIGLVAAGPAPIESSVTGGPGTTSTTVGG